MSQQVVSWKADFCYKMYRF